MKSLLIPACTALALVAACAPLPTQPPQPAPPPEHGPARPADIPQSSQSPYLVREGNFVKGPEQVSGPAVLKLLGQAKGELDAGRMEQAVADLETALNIEPRNPFIWQQMAEAHLAQHLPDQAEHKAQRSNSFARGNPWIEAENWRLIAAARQQRGDLAGARLARERMTEIQETLVP